MGRNTMIGWCHHTFNIVWGCRRVSEGCAHCYAEMLAKRWRYPVWGDATTPRRIMSDRYWDQLDRWNADALQAGVRRRVFECSMADVFEDHPLVAAQRPRLWAAIERTRALDHLLVTKRPEHALTMVPPAWLTAWPPHVWLLTSTENQRQASVRTVWLMEVRERTGAPILGYSAEPLLGPLDFGHLDRLPEPRVAQMLRGTHAAADAAHLAARWSTLAVRYAEQYGDGQTIDALGHGFVDWVIAGGESGPRHRPMDLTWARALRDSCRDTKVAFFFKQVGGRTAAAGGKQLDGAEWGQFPDALCRAAA